MKREIFFLMIILKTITITSVKQTYQNNNNECKLLKSSKIFIKDMHY